MFRRTIVQATVTAFWTVAAFDDELRLQLDHDASGDFTAKDAGDFFGQTVKWDNIGKFLKVIQPPVIGEPLPKFGPVGCCDSGGVDTLECDSAENERIHR